ncbi:MAG: hypothetical protein ACKVJG_21750 [Candidatus Latescibacterota bacterium]
MKKITAALALVVGLSIGAQAQSDLNIVMNYTAEARGGGLLYTFDIELDYEMDMDYEMDTDSPTTPLATTGVGGDPYDASTTDCTSKLLMDILLSQDGSTCEPIELLWEEPHGGGEKTKLHFRVKRSIPTITDYTLRIKRGNRTGQREFTTLPMISPRLAGNQVVIFTMPDEFAKGSLDNKINPVKIPGDTRISVACSPSGTMSDGPQATTSTPYIQLSASDTFEGSSCIPGTVAKHDDGLQFTPHGTIGAGLHYTRGLFINGKNDKSWTGITTLDIE